MVSLQGGCYPTDSSSRNVASRFESLIVLLSVLGGTKGYIGFYRVYRDKGKEMETLVSRFESGLLRLTCNPLTYSSGLFILLGVYITTLQEMEVTSKCRV